MTGKTLNELLDGYEKAVRDGEREDGGSGNDPATARAAISAFFSEGSGRKLWECPECCFAFDAMHTDQDGGYTCPCCAQDKAVPYAVSAAKVIRAALAALEPSVEGDARYNLMGVECDIQAHLDGEANITMADLTTTKRVIGQIADAVKALKTSAPEIRNTNEFSAHPASGNAGVKLTPAETVRYDPAPECKGVIAARESLEPEGSGGAAGSEDRNTESAQNGLTARRDEQPNLSGHAIGNDFEAWVLERTRRDLAAAGADMSKPVTPDHPRLFRVWGYNDVRDAFEAGAKTVPSLGNLADASLAVLREFDAGPYSGEFLRAMGAMRRLLGFRPLEAIPSQGNTPPLGRFHQFGCALLASGEDCTCDAQGNVDGT